jgi:hypothetical protein
MPSGVYNECDIKIRNQLKNSPSFKAIAIGKETLRSIKDDCLNLYKPIHTKNDNDYRLIAAAINENADYLATNDYDLLNMAKEYKKSKGIKKDHMILSKFSNLLWLMYSERKDLFNWRSNIISSVKLYHHVDIQNSVNDLCNLFKSCRNTRELQVSIRDRKSEYIDRAKDRFNPYGQNIYYTLESYGKR